LLAAQKTEDMMIQELKFLHKEMSSARNASVALTFNFEPYYNNHKHLEYFSSEKNQG